MNLIRLRGVTVGLALVAVKATRDRRAALAASTGVLDVSPELAIRPKGVRLIRRAALAGSTALVAVRNE